MNTISIASGVVSGARHLRTGRNGQDAVATWRGPAGAVVVVADGCGSAPSSEVGARLGATLFAHAVGSRLGSGGVGRETWAAARAEVGATLRAFAGVGDVLHECLLFTLVAAAVTRSGEAAVWALGDGAYSFGLATHVLGPFDDNQPPYLAYDLLGEPREAHLAVAPAGCESIVVATDGASELATGIEVFGARRFVEHPDALRRELALLARSSERIDWEARRVVRTPALLQDDCAVGVLRWSVAS